MWGNLFSFTTWPCTAECRGKDRLTFTQPFWTKWSPFFSSLCSLEINSMEKIKLLLEPFHSISFYNASLMFNISSEVLSKSLRLQKKSKVSESSKSWYGMVWIGEYEWFRYEPIPCHTWAKRKVVPALIYLVFLVHNMRLYRVTPLRLCVVTPARKHVRGGSFYVFTPAVYPVRSVFLSR